MRSFLIPILLVTVFLSPTTEARTLFVSPDGDDTTGESWQTAFTAIGDAVVIAVTGDEVWVGQGIYNETILLATPIVLIGGFQGNEGMVRTSIENETIISGEGKEVPVVKCSSTVTIDGFTMKDSDRAGMTIFDDASATVKNCKFTENIGRPGGGLGGGVVIFGTNARFVKCIITNNRALDSGGGIEVRRGSDVTMEDCLITGNAANGGGGVLCVDSSLTMRRCVVTGNTAISPGEFGGSGGGLTFGESGVVRLENCLIHSNRSDVGDQIIIGSEEVPPVFLNCTILSEEGQIIWSDLPPVFRNCVLWGGANILFRTFDSEEEPDVSYSCVQGGHEGAGNISDDPLFVNEVGEDFHLQIDSPCLDTADTEGPSDDLDGNPRPRDLFGVGRDGPGAFDMGAYEFQNTSGDLNGDGEIDMLDLLILDRQWYSVSGVR